jgi:replication factor A2
MRLCLLPGSCWLLNPTYTSLQVDFVGQVRKLSAQATNTTYVVDDGTGVMDVKQWNDNDLPAEAQKFKPNEGDYIHVWGRLKEFSSKRHVGSHVIHPVKDYNEINYHLLHATAVHLYFLRGPIGAPNAIKQEGGLGMFVDGYGGDTNGAGAGGKKLPANTSAIAKKVYTLLQSAPQNNEGLHVNQIATQLSMQLNDVFKAGDELLGDGLIYTTIDDETWAVLEY